MEKENRLWSIDIVESSNEERLGEENQTRKLW